MPTMAITGINTGPVNGGVTFGFPFLKGFLRRFDAINAGVADQQASVADTIAQNTSAPSRDLGGFGPPGGSSSGRQLGSQGGSIESQAGSGLSAPPTLSAATAAPSSVSAAGPGGSLSAPPSRGPGGGAPRGGGGTSSITGGRRGGGGISPNRALRGGGSLLNSR